MGVHAVVLDAQGRVQKQANDSDDLIGQRVAGIALMPLDSVIAQSWVDRATASGVAVVSVARCCSLRCQTGSSYSIYGRTIRA